MALTKITKIGSNGLDDDVSAGGGGLNITDTISLMTISYPSKELTGENAYKKSNLLLTKTIKKLERSLLKSVLFMDIKTGTANLTTLQRRIRDAIRDGRVEFQVYNPEKDIENKKEETSDGEDL